MTKHSVTISSVGAGGSAGGSGAWGAGGGGGGSSSVPYDPADPSKPWPVESWIPAAQVFDRPGLRVTAPSLDYDKAADAILGLINTKPRSPTRDELIATLKSI